jgi:hypothetical protein
MRQCSGSNPRTLTTSAEGEPWRGMPIRQTIRYFPYLWGSRGRRGIGAPWSATNHGRVVGCGGQVGTSPHLMLACDSFVKLNANREHTGLAD